MSISRHWRAPPRISGRASTARCRKAGFLQRLGIETRAVTLMAKTTPEISEDISGALKRLIGGGRGGMGSMFKVLAVSEPRLTSLAGFGRRAPRRQGGAFMMLRSSLLSAIPGLGHAFFTREGGVSDGVYQSLNGGLGSNDDPGNVAENRRRMAEEMGVAPQAACSAPSRSIRPMPWWRPDRGKARRDRAQTPSLRAPRVLRSASPAADCGPILLVDPNARVIGGRSCRVERRADRHCGIHRRRHGKARRPNAAAWSPLSGP